MSRSYAFGEFLLEVDERRLLRGGVELPLPPRVFDTLLLLVQNSGHLVTKDEFLSRLWPDTFVGEDTLAQNISLLRKVLGGTANGQDYVATIPKRGYRFVAPLIRTDGREGNVLQASSAIAAPSDDAASMQGNQARETAGESPIPPTRESSPLPRAPEARVRKFRLGWKGVVSAALLTGALAGGLTYVLLSSHKELKLRQLTANSVENPVIQSVISPDGKYLAFTDSTFKMRGKVIASNETLAVQEPELLKGTSVRWEIADWFPDSTRFLANARPSNTEPNYYSSKGASIWVVPLGGLPRKLRDDAEAFSVSPDGSRIAFGANAADHGDREIWTMNTNGQEARRLFVTDSDSFICCLQWSQDQQHAIYLKGDSSRAAALNFAEQRGSILSSDLQVGTTTAILPISNLEDLLGFHWLPDGRLVYAMRDFQRRNSALWELKTDLRAGKTRGQPKLVSKFDWFTAFGLSATSDGKTVGFTRRASPETIHIADISANGTHFASVKRLTLNEYDNQAQAWAPDGKSIIFLSHRNGSRGLFRYVLDSDREEALAGGANNVIGAAVSPDGFWLLYLDCNQEENCTGTHVPLMRVPLAGGTPALVFKMHYHQYGRPRCAVSPSTLCVIAEQSEDGQPVVFSAFDPLKGRGDELFRFQTKRNVAYHWALSLDGTRIAILIAGSSRIYTIHLNGQPSSETTVNGWANLSRLFWTSDRKGWFTSAKTEAGWTLLHVDLEGNAERLWDYQGPSLAHAIPSPDGRRLAINAISTSGNAWLLENF